MDYGARRSAPLAGLLRLYCALVGVRPHKVIYRLALATPRGKNPFCRLFHDLPYFGHGESRARIGRYRPGKRRPFFRVVGIRVCVIPRGEGTELSGECIGKQLGEEWDRFRGLRGFRARGFGRGFGLRLGLSLGVHGIPLYGLGFGPVSAEPVTES